ncbi:hypothetical protein MTO96_012744 [Rhipicephalus appendiculatus]
MKSTGELEHRGLRVGVVAPQMAALLVRRRRGDAHRVHPHAHPVHHDPSGHGTRGPHVKERCEPCLQGPPRRTNATSAAHAVTKAAHPNGHDTL